MVATSPPTPHATHPFSLHQAESLLDTYGSPLYVYDGDRLRQTIQHITQSIPYPRTRFHFASVTNGNLALLQIFRKASWGLHANTPGDIYLGLQAGFHPSQIIYSGSNLNRAEMEQLFRWDVTTLNLDSLAQLELSCETWRFLQDTETETSLSASTLTPHTPYPTPHLGLRLNLPALTGDSRIGIRLEEFPAAVSMAQQAGLQINGLHFYRGTGTNATTAFTEAIDTVLTTAKQLPDWTYLDFGGGFGYPYHHDGAAFNWNQFGAALSDRLAQLDRPIDLVIEPGRAAIAGCATLLTQVVSVKWQDDKQIVGVDTTVANLSVPSVHGGYREIVTWEGEKEAEGRRQGAEGCGVSWGIGCGEDNQTQSSELKTQNFPTDVCGNTTYSRDYLGKNCQLPALKMGDMLAILDVGAYGYAMSSHFLHRLRPAEVLLEKGTHRLIRKRETYSILMENQLFERHSPEVL
ncbi:diaminopimelate decarboxylase family protein [Stenomitos frigidus]|uniref:Decarboxylase n=1 Tax=Stenomitos frigidus ULC18 TaxID=2107698 RepID=A0A2T1ESK4_9CYAN|nr:decarboxylase [Stenomitos frigidus]PSB35717.1 decarboxylase [Stenomitos frigidus ULC18]